MENLKIVDNKEIMKKQIAARDDFVNVLEGVILRWVRHTNPDLAKIKELKVVRYMRASNLEIPDPNEFTCGFGILYQNNRIVGYELNSKLGKFVPVRVSSTRLSISRDYLGEKKFPELNITLDGSVDRKFDNGRKIINTISAMFLDVRIDECLELKKELLKPNNALSIAVPKSRIKQHSLNVMQSGGLTPDKIKECVVMKAEPQPFIYRPLLSVQDEPSKPNNDVSEELHKMATIFKSAYVRAVFELGQVYPETKSMRFYLGVPKYGELSRKSALVFDAGGLGSIHSRDTKLEYDTDSCVWKFKVEPLYNTEYKDYSVSLPSDFENQINVTEELIKTCIYHGYLQTLTKMGYLK